MFLQYVISAPEHISCDLHFILAFSMKMIINRLNLRSGPQTRICGGREETCRRWLFQWIVFPSVSVRLNDSTNSGVDLQLRVQTRSREVICDVHFSAAES